VYRDQLKRAVITVIGEGELFAECQRRIREYGVEGLVEMRGFVDSATKTRLLATSDIFCLPSHTEGTPIAVLEAMGSELPIVATNVGGIPFVVQHGTQGWLCAPGDVAGLGRMLIHLVKNASVRAAMGRNGLRRVREQFDIQTVAKLFITRLNAFDAESRYREDEAPAAAGASNQI
jgi:glycosyltransferase involved in cell wall biosynthesis